MPQSSSPEAFLSSGGKLFFHASVEPFGREPWVHDENGTRLIRDILPGNAAASLYWFREVSPGVVVFFAHDGAYVPQLWRSDGTEAGTTRIRSFASNARTQVQFSYGGRVFFTASDGVHGAEPWSTDGTVEGTQMLADTVDGSTGSGWVRFFRFNDQTRFSTSRGIWSTDGTTAGTVPTVSLTTIAATAVAGDKLVIARHEPTTGYELWRSDGTDAGTSLVKDIRPGSTGGLSESTTFGVLGSRAVFFANDGTGLRLWTTDGTADNTFALTAFPVWTSPDPTPVFGQTPTKGVFFSASTSVWRTDGTPAGTYVAAQMSGTSWQFVEAFSNVYFQSWTSGPTAMFRIDGSANATPTRITGAGVNTFGLTFTGGKLWFAGSDSERGAELWVSDDGTPEGTHLVANLAPDPNPSSSPTNFFAYGRHLLFHPQVTTELWRSDGTSGGTFELTNVDNTLFSPPPFAWLTPYQGSLYYLRGHSDLYRLDPATGATALVGAFNFDVIDGADDVLYLWSNFGGFLRSDGTSAGTFRLYDPSEPSDVRWDGLNLTVYAGRAWAFSYEGLYLSEGTLETTRRVVTMPSGASLGYPYDMANGALYCVQSSIVAGNELWRSDGTAEGSGVVKDISPGQGSSFPQDLMAAGSLLFFTADDGIHGHELWRTDGTADGTFMVRDILPGSSSSGASQLAVLNGVVYFRANDGTAGAELWKSDGTEAGTVMVRDVAPGSMSSNPTWLRAQGGKIWFSANDGLRGFEPWTSDGTEEGTFLIGDIIAGSGSSSPDQFTAAGAHVFFSAMTVAEGRELWAYPLTQGFLSIADARVVEGHSGTRALRFKVTRSGDTSGAASVAYAITAGSAISGTDFDAASGTLEFAAGDTVETFDVNVRGDLDLELNETLFARLSSPAGAALQTSVATGVIEDDDARVDLAVELQPYGSSNYEPIDRMVKVTNYGPSSAFDVAVQFTESPYQFEVNGFQAKCQPVNPSRCVIPMLQPGQSRTFRVSRWYEKGIVDPAQPPGRTVTVSVSSSATDTDSSNNTASRMMTGNGTLFLPPSLTAGETATVTYSLEIPAQSAIDVTLTSSAQTVAVSPATARIEAGQQFATFTLTTGAGASSTLLTATVASQTHGRLVVPIVAPGQTPKLDVAIVADKQASLDYGAPFNIAVNVAARYPDGVKPTGTVTLLDVQGNTVDQRTLDGNASATFARPTLAPGQYQYRVRYEGDSRFNALNVLLPATTINRADVRIDIHAPFVSCSTSVEVRVLVTAKNSPTAPAGTVDISGLARLTLVPTGVPGESSASSTVAFTVSGSLQVTYEPDGFFASQFASKQLYIGCQALSLVATATAPTTVALSWTGSPTWYWIYRGESIESLAFVNVTTSTSYVDSTAQPGRTYVYRVRPDGQVFSHPDIASTFAFTDDPLAAGTLIKSVHLAELRSMTTAFRRLAELPVLAFTGSVTAGSVVDFRHVGEIRDSIDAARARIGVAPFGWTQPVPARGSIIHAAPLQELRNAVK